MSSGAMTSQGLTHISCARRGHLSRSQEDSYIF